MVLDGPLKCLIMGILSYKMGNSVSTFKTHGRRVGFKICISLLMSG